MSAYTQSFWAKWANWASRNVRIVSGSGLDLSHIDYVVMKNMRKAIGITMKLPPICRNRLS